MAGCPECSPTRSLFHIILIGVSLALIGQVNTVGSVLQHLSKALEMTFCKPLTGPTIERPASLLHGCGISGWHRPWSVVEQGCDWSIEQGGRAFRYPECLDGGEDLLLVAC